MFFFLIISDSTRRNEVESYSNTLIVFYFTMGRFY
nr:MAG TPA: hypothetical protein [Bacteriophage sp.]